MRLTRRIGSDIAVTESDTLTIKSALQRLGLYATPRYGMTPYPDEAMIAGLKAVQARLGREATGSIRPGGPEEAVLGRALADSSGGGASGMVHVRSYEQSRNGKTVPVSEYDRTAPEGGHASPPEKSPRLPRMQLPVPGGTIRGHDRWGDGKFGSNRDHGRPHMGVDIADRPGQPVGSTVSGTVVSSGNPVYSPGRVKEHPKKAEYTSVSVRTDNGFLVKHFYVDPGVRVGDRVEAGQAIGTAQNLGHAYPGITNHVHVEVWDGNKRVDPTPGLYPSQ